MGEIWPTTWLNAANAIRTQPKKQITPQQLWDIITESQVADISKEVLARWLHELGEILYFQDNEELNDTVILKPQWVTEYISKVLESKDVSDRLGIFTRQEMNQLWRDLERSMRDHFLRLMERFDLSYRTQENRDISLNVFVLRLHGDKAWKKNLTGQKLDLQLYCQAPGCWHSTQEGGLYEINEPAKWLRAIAPYLGRLFKVLKYALHRQRKHLKQLLGIPTYTSNVYFTKIKVL
ncbi:COR domain-containing protein [Nostoc sp.]|uniref:COR domain-containing protein n=1 Tax=Nostoc sp. TaxID=1180 RepID=UPI002FF53269